MKKSRYLNLFWLFFEKFGLTLISVFSFLCFAFFLTPAELGLATLAIAICEIVSQFFGATLENPLVRKGRNNKDASSVFWLGPLAPLSFMLIACYVSYKALPDSIFWQLLLILGLSVYANIASRPFIAILRIERNFKSLAIRTLWGKLIGAAFAIVVAYFGGGEWALVSQLVVMNSVAFTILFFSSKIKLNFLPSFKLLSNIFYEGLPIGVRKLSKSSFERGVVFIVALLGDPALVGYYSFAKRLVELPKQAIETATMSYALPVFTKRITEKTVVNKLFFNVSFCLFYLTIPCFLIYGVNGSFLIDDVFGEKWLASANFFIFFACIACIQIFSILSPPLIASEGKAKTGLKYEIILTVFTLGASIITSNEYGIGAILTCFALHSSLIAWIQIKAVNKTSGIELIATVTAWLRFFVAAAITASISYYIHISLQLSVLVSILTSLAAVIAYYFLCLVLYRISYKTVVKAFNEQ